MIAVSLQRMKGQRIRYRQTGEFHFLTFSCYRRRPYLKSIAAMEIFEDALERVRLRYLFVIAGYVVMPEHVYLWMLGLKLQSSTSPVPNCEGPGAPSTGEESP
jgi:REP element-mobilizing transposase RayT